VFLPILTTSICRHDVDRGTPGRAKHSRSIQEDHATLDIRRQVSSRYSVHFWVTDIHYGRGGRSQDAAPRASTGASCSGSIIYIRRCMLRSGSFCRAFHPHHQAHLHRHRPPIKIHPMTTLRSRPILVGTPPGKIASSSWVVPNGDRSHNSSSRNPTIGRSEASDARSPNVGIIRNLNPEFNAMRLQTIMETI
jgi:hypothetical protein